MRSGREDGNLATLRLWKTPFNRAEPRTASRIFSGVHIVFRPYLLPERQHKRVKGKGGKKEVGDSKGQGYSGYPESTIRAEALPGCSNAVLRQVARWGGRLISGVCAAVRMTGV